MKLKNNSKRHSLFSSLGLLTLIAIFGVNGFAQCEGVYGKPKVRQIIFSESVNFESNYGSDKNNAMDLTGDGVLDLVGTAYGGAPRYEADRLLIFPGNGDFTFRAPIVLRPPANSRQFNAYFVDYNLDGNLDVIFHYLEDGTGNKIYSVNLNDGNGNFTLLRTLFLQPPESLAAIADLNGDKVIDLVVTDYSNYYYKPGNPDGTFGANVPVPPGDFGLLRDYDGDGSLDFPARVDGRSWIYLNDGHGNFSPGAGTIPPYSIRQDSFDLNNDGKSDLVTRDDPQFVVSLSRGDGTFDETLYDYAGYFAYADINGDSFLDIILYHSMIPFYRILTNDGTGHFTARDYDSYLKGLPLGDFDEDGKADFFNAGASDLFGDIRVSILKNVCDRFGQTKIVDFDQNGITDQMLWNESTGSWRYKSPYYSPEKVFRWGASGDIPVPGDFDGDEVTDLAVFRPSDGVWYIQTSESNTVQYTRFGTNADKPVASDFDGDGKTDIAVYRPSEGNWYILSSVTGEYSVSRFGSSGDLPIPHDYDGDGKSDAAVFRPSTGIWYVLKSSDGNFTGANWGVETDIPVPGDYDGDGKADLAVFRPSEGNWYILQSYNNQYGVFNLGVEGDIPQPGDWTGNGIMDLAVYRQATNSWHINWSGGIRVFGGVGDRPISSLLPLN